MIMQLRISATWLPVDKIYATVQFEPALIILSLSLLAWAIYKVLLRKVSKERHKNLRGHFSNLFVHILFSTAFFVAFWLLQWTTPFVGSYRIGAYLGLVAMIWGLGVFVKTCRIFAFEYLFLKHMREGVPLLLVNLISLLLSGVIGAWLLTDIFEIRLLPVLATSAIFSIVLGLALQDTLGNLFAGVALQFDKPFDLGDWIEVQNGSQKWIGQVMEVSWRATVLLGFLDEVQTVPNRVIAQSQISNYSAKTQPVIRTQTFRVGYDTPVERVKTALLQAAAQVSGVRHDPSPLVLITENTESWLLYKLIYYVDDFGAQYVIGDRVIAQALKSLEESKVKVATQKIQLVQ